MHHEQQSHFTFTIKNTLLWILFSKQKFISDLSQKLKTLKEHSAIKINHLLSIPSRLCYERKRLDQIAEKWKISSLLLFYSSTQRLEAVKIFKFVPITIRRIEGRTRHEWPSRSEAMRIGEPSSILLHSRNVGSLSRDLRTNQTHHNKSHMKIHRAINSTETS